MTNDEAEEIVMKLAEDIFSSFADTAVDAVCAYIKQLDLSLCRKIIDLRTNLTERIELVSTHSESIDDLILDYLRKLKKVIANLGTKVNDKFDGIENLAKEKAVKAAKEAIIEEVIKHHAKDTTLKEIGIFSKSHLPNRLKEVLTVILKSLRMA